MIAAKATALPEVVGESGLLIDPDDVDGWAAAMIELLTTNGAVSGSQKRPSPARRSSAGRRRASTCVTRTYAPGVVRRERVGGVSALRTRCRSDGEVITSITRELVARGHRLHVITSLPWYRHHRIEDGWGGKMWREQQTEWGRITRVHPFPTDKRNIPARAIAFGGFTALTSIVASISWPRPDVVLAMSPPLTLGLAGWMAARLRGAPFVFNIQDVFPDVAVELGVITNPT